MRVRMVLKWCAKQTQKHRADRAPGDRSLCPTGCHRDTERARVTYRYRAPVATGVCHEARRQASAKPNPAERSDYQPPEPPRRLSSNFANEEPSPPALLAILRGRKPSNSVRCAAGSTWGPGELDRGGGGCGREGDPTGQSLGFSSKPRSPPDRAQTEPACCQRWVGSPAPWETEEATATGPRSPLRTHREGLRSTRGQPVTLTERDTGCSAAFLLLLLLGLFLLRWRNGDTWPDDRSREVTGAPSDPSRRAASSLEAAGMSFLLIDKPPLPEADLRYKGEVVFERDVESYFAVLQVACGGLFDTLVKWCEVVSYLKELAWLRDVMPEHCC
ncbi:hypothetical protein AAFF_G00041500 [Aldrovandia affinis]|uniref:Uncharacterized protein n=1 Tax=Aldrovandia affinis TaxID=143900 RepID=A0AAD7S2G9_9TELE|nr:hypothetical protein AAFF_G00041500 [Aldrovandia affinis]